MLLNHSKYTAHFLQDARERLLRLTQLASHLNFFCGENGDALAHHLGRDFNLSPAPKIGRTCGRGMKGPRICDEDVSGLEARDLAGPAHAGVDTKEPLFRRQGCQDFADSL